MNPAGPSPPPVDVVEADHHVVHRTPSAIADALISRPVEPSCRWRPGTAIALTASIGVLIDRGTATAAVSLVAAADPAMYQAPPNGPDAVVFAFGGSASWQ